MKTHFEKEPRTYSGTELAPHFLLKTYDLRGNAVAAFIGPCDVKTEHLVDLEDQLAQDFIRAGEMVHFIAEIFEGSLREAVLIQRLWISELERMVRERISVDWTLWREGDDLMLEHTREGQARKLTVSIATASPVSRLIHIGVNVDPKGAPVPAIGLRELGIEAKEWVPLALARMAEIDEDVRFACAKVRPV